MKRASLVILTIPLALAACVSKSQYDLKAQEADTCAKDLDTQKQTVTRLQQQVAEDEKQISDLKTAAGLAQSQSQSLSDEQKAELEEAKRAVSEAQERAKLLDDLQSKFKKMIDAGHLK